MSRSFATFAFGLMALASTVNAATLVFSGDPLAGIDPGDGVRQVVGPNTQMAFDVTTDILGFDIESFGITQFNFANDLTGNLPTNADLNFIVVQDTGNPFGAGTAANLIADRIDQSGAGFFIYFNTNLQVARLVYSSDLNSTTSDLAILARLTTFSGPAGLAALPTITAANVAPIPEPSSVLLTAGGALLVAARAWRKRRAN